MYGDNFRDDVLSKNSFDRAGEEERVRLAITQVVWGIRTKGYDNFVAYMWPHPNQVRYEDSLYEGLFLFSFYPGSIFLIDNLVSKDIKLISDAIWFFVVFIEFCLISLGKERDNLIRHNIAWFQEIKVK